MKHLIVMTLACLGLTLGAGCGSKDAFDDAISGIKGYRDKMCKCTDKACVDKVTSEYETWKDNLKSKLKSSGAKPSKSQDEQLDKAEDELEKCAEEKGGE